MARNFMSNKTDWIQIERELRSINWLELTTNRTPDDIYEVSYGILLSTYLRSPLCTFRKGNLLGGKRFLETEGY